MDPVISRQSVAGHDLGSPVRIVQNNREGFIDAIFQSRNCDTQYRVVYADHNGLVVDRYFFTEDLQVIAR